MRRLKVALVHWDHPRKLSSTRLVGSWSYDVPEFAVTHFPVGEDHTTARSLYAAARFDVIFQEDHRCYGPIKPDAAIPLLYYVVDAPASESHYQMRRQTAQRNRPEIVLLDSDRLGRWRGYRSFRWQHAVQDRVFLDYGLEKEVDVSFVCHVWGNEQRVAVHQALQAYCKRHGLRYFGGKVLNGVGYAQMFNRSKVTVNFSVCPGRNHRVLDAMACRTTLLTNPVPDCDDGRKRGVHYAEYDSTPQGAVSQVEALLASGGWRALADAGYELIQARHTWAIRARELRALISRELGL